jgi:hypothetical protein
MTYELREAIFKLLNPSMVFQAAKITRPALVSLSWPNSGISQGGIGN